ncbi:hypothetical protein [Streptomyces sp. NPDC051662]|uniref:hypothetical protein n=1 Tax=Streptomyces sp. NPDC051662 TaxID=3154750 RepID=UPI00341CA487
MSTSEASLETRTVVSEQIARLHRASTSAQTQPRLDFAPYRGSAPRHPTRALWLADPEGAELVAPAFGHGHATPMVHGHA